MSDNPNRDTQFQGFAKALLEEVHDPIADYWREDTPEVIARRAYDLVQHVFDCCDFLNLDMGGIEGPRNASEVPDMTAFSSEQEA